MKKDSKIFVAGHKGLVGSSIVRALKLRGHTNIITAKREELDLTSPEATNTFFENIKPEYVFLAAAKVGGIHANDTYPADFISINLKIQTNIIYASYKNKVEKLLFLGSSCIYPKNAPQPMKEEHLLTGKLEPTNDAYAIAKIAGIIMCESYNRQHGTNFIAAMPTNLYGPGDNFSEMNSHVLAALIKKFYEAKLNKLENVTLWGTGKPMREFLYVDDLADALLFMMDKFSPERGHTFLNVGTGRDISIKDLAHLVKDIVGFDGEILWNTKMPDGTPKKLLDVSPLNELGWKAKASLKDGIQKTVTWFIEMKENHNL